MKRIVLALAFGCVMGVVNARDPRPMGRGGSGSPRMVSSSDAARRSERVMLPAKPTPIGPTRFTSRMEDLCDHHRRQADEPRRRPHINIGTEIEIPDTNSNGQIESDRPRIVFLSRGGYVFAYVQPGGV